MATSNIFPFATRGFKGAPATLLLRVVPRGGGWSWHLFSGAGASRPPRLIFADSMTFSTAEDAADAGRAALYAAVASFVISDARAA
jgi:hypothetical protein